MIKIHCAKVMHHVGAGVYLKEVFVFYFITKIIVTMWQNTKILNGRMITCVAARHMVKMAEFPDKCCLTLVAKCLFVLPI